MIQRDEDNEGEDEIVEATPPQVSLKERVEEIPDEIAAVGATQTQPLEEEPVSVAQRSP